MIYDLYVPPAKLCLFHGPSYNVVDMWSILGHGATDGALQAGGFQHTAMH